MIRPPCSCDDSVGGVLSEVWASAGGSSRSGMAVRSLRMTLMIRCAGRFGEMRDVFAQLERGLIRRQMSNGKWAKAEAGGHVGGPPPLGQRSDSGVRATDQSEADVVRPILGLHEKGLSLRHSTAEPDAAGIASKRGGPCHTTTLARVARSNRQAIERTERHAGGHGRRPDRGQAELSASAGSARSRKRIDYRVKPAESLHIPAADRAFPIRRTYKAPKTPLAASAP